MPLECISLGWFPLARKLRDNYSLMKVNKIVDLSTQALIATVIDKSVASVAHNWKLGKSAHLVLTGGRTGVQLAQTLDTEIFRLITSPEFLSSNSREPFQLHIWFSDERFTSLEDNERTDTKLINAFEKNVDNPRISIIFHRVSSPEVLSLTEAANAYAAELDDLLTGSNFDAVLLSMGEDGHIASLFPGLSTTAHSTKSAVPVDNSPKPPAQRVSIGLRQHQRFISSPWVKVSVRPSPILSRGVKDRSPFSLRREDLARCSLWLTKRFNSKLFKEIRVSSVEK